MSSADASTTPGGASDVATGLAQDAARILAEAQRLVAEDRTSEVSEQTVQDLLLAAVRLFAAKRQQGPSFAAFAADAVTATDVAVTCVAMTEVVNLELFELALWHGWSNV